MEDEPHKKEELTASLEGFFKGEADLEHVDSVHAAYWAVSEHDYDLIILDMALPTFTAEGDAAERGFDQAQGGVEVLRALKVLSQRYGQDVVGSVLYKYRSPSNHTKLTALLKKFA